MRLLAVAYSVNKPDEYFINLVKHVLDVFIIKYLLLIHDDRVSLSVVFHSTCNLGALKGKVLYFYPCGHH